ncbi:MAG: hypothetical protein AB1374_06465 [Bacillota bacterium]
MPAGFAGTVLHYGLFLYQFTLEIAVTLALALTLNGYDIKQNRRRVLVLAVVLGAAGVAFFYLPQWLKSILTMIVGFTAIRFCFGFTTGRAVLVFFIFLLAVITVEFPANIIILDFLRLSPSEYLASPLIRLLYPLPYIPLAVFTYVAYRRGWRIFKDRVRLKASAAVFLLPGIQFLLILIPSNELFDPHSDRPFQTIGSLIRCALYVSTAFSLFFFWRLFQTVEREAAVAAREQTAAEMRARADVVCAQRHDFVNHVQVMVALLQEGRKEELARYAAGIKRNL